MSAGFGVRHLCPAEMRCAAHGRRRRTSGAWNAQAFQQGRVMPISSSTHLMSQCTTLTVGTERQAMP